MSFVGKIIKITLREMSWSSFIIAFVVLLLLEVVAFIIGPKIEKNVSFKDNIRGSVHRLIEFNIMAAGLSIGLLGYWIVKDLNPNNTVLAADILLPILLLIIGRFVHKLCSIAKRNNSKSTSVDREAETRNEKFLILVVLLYLMIIGFMSDTKTGAIILAIILGRFLWIDTTWKTIISEIQDFKPTSKFALQLVIPIGLISIILFKFVFPMNASSIYGVFWGLTIELFITGIVLVIRNINKKYKNRISNDLSKGQGR